MIRRRIRVVHARQVLSPIRSPPHPKRDNAQCLFCLLVLQGVSLFHRFDSQQRVRVRHSQRPSSQHVVRMSRLHVLQTENGKVETVGPAMDIAAAGYHLFFFFFQEDSIPIGFQGVRCRRFKLKCTLSK